MSSDRPHDLVLFGATGYTGALTAEYIAANAPDGLRWALAGRTPSKLEKTRARLAERHPQCAELPLLQADVDDERSVREVVDSTRAVITTVGPYVDYGEPFVAACAAAGTDYVDITGEPEFVDLMYVRHHARAVETGARLVHACGFDSVPHDLGAYFTVKQLPEGEPLKVEGFVRVSGSLSGGTLASALTSFSRLRSLQRAQSARRDVEPRLERRRARATRPLPRYERAIGAWALPMPTIDPEIVARSGRALERYGPDFSYAHFLAVKRLPVAVGVAGGAAALIALSQIPPARSFLLGRVPAGSGPSAEQRQKGWFSVRFIGEGGGRRVMTEVSGGEPGYGETPKMAAEAAFCLLYDDLPQTAGQVTTAAAMGDRLIERLDSAGIRFKVVD